MGWPIAHVAIWRCDDVAMTVPSPILAVATVALGTVACWAAWGSGRAFAREGAPRMPDQSMAERRYDAVRDGSLVTLTDRVSETAVTVVPSVGNIATAFRVKGHNV